MTGRRRGIWLRRTQWGTAWWFVTSRLAITLATLSALTILAAALALTRAWQAQTEDRVVYVPVPTVVTGCPDEDIPAPRDTDGGERPRPAPKTPVPEAR